ncbi:MAG: 4Fe-4S dicluster domain-containing protein [Clostridiales Family XIII bacterium]|jgi:epoxyqueuosine reductase QueG|nr:4Fe-4S dicluster domain-containing protein [Clostridiales Family XIII bacterium]
MDDLSNRVRAELFKLGADIVGFGDLRGLPSEARDGLPTGICVAVKYPPAVIRGIAELPTREYREWYDRLNERLDFVVTEGASFIKGLGFGAVAQTRAKVGTGEAGYDTALPHKTVATRAGVGWIGKSALLVTEEYGSMLRLSTILTDAPLETSEPIDASRCGGCSICAGACPAGAISGGLWAVGLRRDDFFDPAKCAKTAKERSRRGFGDDVTICGKCIEVCPYARRVLGK